MNENRIPLQTLREHHAIWRWRIEVDSSRRLVRSWRTVAAADLHDDTKAQLMNVAWSLASFQRSYAVLVEDADRAERARADGVPPIMALLTGPYERSLEYLLTMTLWMDLGDLCVAYRTVVDRFKRLKGSVRHERLSVSLEQFTAQTAILEDRRLPSLSAAPVTSIADRIVHAAWHPTGDDALSLGIQWKGDAESPIIDFAPGDVRGELCCLVEETSSQVNEFIEAQAPDG